MADAAKAIQFSGHAKEQMRFRGATEAEVVEAIQTTPWGPAENARMECRKDFVFNSIWNRQHYATNRFGRSLYKNRMQERVRPVSPMAFGRPSELMWKHG
jgi:hypothetical protein